MRIVAGSFAEEASYGSSERPSEKRRNGIERTRLRQCILSIYVRVTTATPAEARCPSFAKLMTREVLVFTGGRPRPKQRFSDHIMTLLKKVIRKEQLRDTLTNFIGLAGA